MTRSTPAAAQVTWAQVHAFRLRRHHLTDATPRSGVVAVARDIGGAQAQVMSAAEMQIAARSHATAADVRHALWEDRSLVKTWLMRGTLHLVPSDDLPVYTAAMQGSWVKARSSWLNYLQITDVEMTRLIDDIAEAMGGTPITRQEILARVGAGHSERVRETLRSGWGGMLKPVARRGLLCFGPSRGQSVTFVNPAAGSRPGGTSIPMMRSRRSRAAIWARTGRRRGTTSRAGGGSGQEQRGQPGRAFHPSSHPCRSRVTSRTCSRPISTR